MSGPRPSAPTVELVCRTCDKPFTRLKRDVKEGRGGFCSHKCAGIHQPRVAPLSRECARCQKPFLLPAHRAKQGRGVYCSPACRKNPPPVVMAQQPQPTRKSAPPRPTSITPKAADRVILDGWADTGSVLCARCKQPRPRGAFCQRCEYRAFESEVAS